MNFWWAKVFIYSCLVYIIIISDIRLKWKQFNSISFEKVSRGMYIVHCIDIDSFSSNAPITSQTLYSIWWLFYQTFLVNFDIIHCHCVYNYKIKVDNNFRTSFIWYASVCDKNPIRVWRCVGCAGKKLSIPFIMKLCCKIKSFSQYTLCWKWWMNGETHLSIHRLVNE